MSAAPAPKTLTADDLLALVRKSPQQFQKKAPVEVMDGAAAQNFVPQSPLRRVEDPAPAPAPSVEPEDIPETNIPDAAPDTGTAPEAETVDHVDTFSPSALPKVIDMEAERQVAWQAGFDQAMQEIEAARVQAREEALAQARAEADATLDEVRSAFETALARLNTAEEEVAVALTAHLDTAVRVLASDRAGQKIDDTPPPFQRRIEKMARDIAAGAESLVVQMNPADLMAIKPHIKSFSPLSKARLAPDPALGRGDVRLKMDEITFADVIAERQTGGLR
jgi:flagellar assembly protein FliH